MKIVLDTDKKTITVPWNYTAKLEEINRMSRNSAAPTRRSRPSVVTLTNAGVRLWSIPIPSSKPLHVPLSLPSKPWLRELRLKS